MMVTDERPSEQSPTATDCIDKSVRRNLALPIALTFAALSLVTACRPLYLPVIPEEIPFTPQVRATGENLVSFDPAGYPTIELALHDVSEAGWLAVQWLAPNGNEAASQSVWIEPAADQRVEFTLPSDVELRGGEWRAVVSLNGRLVRQLNFEVEPKR